MKAVFIILILIHGLVHLIGHYNAYNPGKIDGMTLPVSRPYGFLWLSTALLLIISSVLLLLNLNYWWILGCISLVLSQILVIKFWQDARFGTIGNVVLLFGLIVGYGSWSFHQDFRQDIREGLIRTASLQEELLTENDLKHLPAAVKKYLEYTGVVGQPKVNNFKVRLRGEMRSEGQDWFKLKTEQYNFIDQFERLFFLQAKVKYLPVSGYHEYQDRQAGMIVKVLSLFPIVEEYGQDMLIAETVTLFNDMCIMAPATLINDNITWQEVDDKTVIGKFRNGEATISAVLKFNEQGQLVNFVSDDRYNLDKKQTIRFSTPVSNYKERNGLTLATYGEAIWHHPTGDFVYGKFKIRSIRYNVVPGKER